TRSSSARTPARPEGLRRGPCEDEARVMAKAPSATSGPDAMCDSDAFVLTRPRHGRARPSTAVSGCPRPRASAHWMVTNTALGAPQLPAASWLSTITRCLPEVHPVVSMVAVTPSCLASKAPSEALIAYRVTPLAHEGASTL